MPESKNQFVESKVNVRSLKKGMIIKAYTKFSGRYRSMNQPTCEFVRHNFKRTRAIIIRDEKKLSLPIKYIKKRDSLAGLFDFPPELQKITVVTDGFGPALEKRGMLEFIIVRPKTLKKLAQVVKQSTKTRQVYATRNGWKTTLPSTKIVSELVDSVKNSVSIRKETSQSIETEMDNARKGVLGIKAIEHAVNNIAANSSNDALLCISSLKKSQQTYDHCVDVGVIFQKVYLKIQPKRKKKSVFSKKNQAMLGGFLYDFGKSVVPREILDSEQRFEKSSRAMQIIRSHPMQGARQLTSLNMPRPIVDMALNHHVKANTDMLTSYPQNSSHKNISFEARLISIIDIYQALVGTRNYKKSWSPAAAMRYLEALAGVEIDQYVFDLFIREMGAYPIGSLVELNDNSLGFVMNVPDGGKDLNRPIVAIVRNSQGQDLTLNHVLDLARV